MQFEKSAQNWGLDQASFSNGAAYADFDNDGDLDIVVSNINAPAFLYRNNVAGQKASNYLRFELDESQNKSVLGTKLYVYHDNQVQFIEAINAKGIYSTSENTLHFGLGKSMQADSLLVKWPNNKTQTIYKIAANQKLVLHMDDAQLHSDTEENSPTLFSEVAPGSLSFKHQENDFDDYAHQVLLPHKMSQFGPALAKADVNGDGLEDLYLGGATHQAGRLLLQQKGGGFLSSNAELLAKESPYEDVDALFLDINGDSFPDLYVVSGGNAYSANDFHYSDRVYMNDGKGNFKKGAIVGIARTSGGVVKASDVDADGDLDLYVGGRHVPHQYPSPATSMLLINNKGQLENATERLAPDFKHIGMVTDAVWTDYDQDGDQDLMMVGEWMPITVFENKNGALNKIVLKDFENTSGWWFSIESKDMDGDGDPDYVVGNLGLNYKYKTSEVAPFDVYYNDFDGNGMYDIVLGYYNENKHFPLRGFSCSSEQVPILKSTFKKYDVFASLQIEEVYGEENLKQSLHYKTQTFASFYIENKGEGVFELRKLPAPAQWTNLNDILLDDFNKDGHMDILAVGNLFVSEIETPRNDAGLGLFLKGNSKGQFESVPMLASGFHTPLDAKKVLSMDVKGKPHIVVVNNNAPLQLFELRN